MRPLRRFRFLLFNRSSQRYCLLVAGGAIAITLVAACFSRGAALAYDAVHEAVRLSPYCLLIVAPIGFALTSWLTTRFVPGAQGGGVSQTIAALDNANPGLRSQLLSLRLGLGKVILSLVGLLSGASMGREGPMVQVGASIMCSLGRWLSFSRASIERGLILAGGAAGVSATFNAPLTGIVFAIEQLNLSFERRITGVVIAAVVVAGVVSLALLGDHVYFGRTSATLAFDKNWLVAVGICGVLGGVLGGVFSRILIMINDSFPTRLCAFRDAYPLLFAALCGLSVAALGLLSANTIYGTGYAETRALLAGDPAVPETFAILKLLATILSTISGIPGGIFGPSLAVGAGLGHNISTLLPAVPFGAVVVLGMASYFSGAIRSPITAFVIVIEMTHDVALALPLITTSLIAYAVSTLVCPKPLLTSLAQSFKPRLKRLHGSPSGLP